MRSLIFTLLITTTTTGLCQISSPVVYDPAANASLLKGLVQQEKSFYQQVKTTVEASKTAQYTAKVFEVSKSMSNDIQEIKKIADQVQKAYTMVNDATRVDLSCVFSSLLAMLKNNFPNTKYSANLNKYYGDKCNFAAQSIYNIINPYNAYNKAQPRYSIVNAVKDQIQLQTVKNQSLDTKLAIEERYNLTKIELSAQYDKLGDEKIKQSNELTNKLKSTSVSESPETYYKLSNDASTALREGMDYKLKALELLKTSTEMSPEMKAHQRLKSANYWSNLIANRKSNIN